MFKYQSVQIFIETMFHELDHARSAMYEANIHAGAGKDALAEAKLADAEKHIKILNAKFDSMKVEMSRIRDAENDN